MVLDDGTVEKTVRVRALCKAEWFDSSQAAAAVPVEGLAVVVRSKQSSIATIEKLINVTVGSHHRRGFTLTPGVSDKWRRTTVRCQDIPSCYTITGLEAYEMPVVGMYLTKECITFFHINIFDINKEILK